MRILVLTHEFPPVGGGGGRVARDISTRLAQRGHDVRVLTAHLEGLSSDEMLDGVRIQRVPSKRQAAFRAEFFEMLRYDWAALIFGLKIFREWKPDLIHAHFAVPAGAAAFTLSKLSHIPYVLTVHLGDVPGAIPEKTDRWFKWVYPFTPLIWGNASKIVAVSEFTRRLALQHYDLPVDVIPNGVTMDQLPVRPAYQGAPRIVFAGRFVEQKNPQHLVESLSRLKDLPWTCNMLGDGPLLEAVREMVAGCGLSGRFSLPGWVTPEEVLNAFAQSDILVLPSHSEGLSVVGVQALGMGLALVLSDAGGNAELMQDGENGFLFQVGDIEALTSALKKLLEDRAMLQSAQQKSRELAKRFDLEMIVEHYERLFRIVGLQSKV